VARPRTNELARDLVMDLLAQQPHTLTSLADASGLRFDTVSRAVKFLQSCELVFIVREVPITDASGRVRTREVYSADDAYSNTELQAAFMRRHAAKADKPIASRADPVRAALAARSDILPAWLGGRA